MRKKNIFSTIILVFCTFFSSLYAQSTMDDLKAQKETLKLNTKLNDLKIDLQKEKNKNADYLADVETYNLDAGVSNDQLSSSENPKDAAKNAKKVAKRLKSAEKANDKLIRSNRKIEDYELKIFRLAAKIGKLDQQLNFNNGKKEEEKKLEDVQQ